MIATVTLNPSLDKTVYVDALALDDTNRARRFRYDPGGKGLNVSRVLWELGEPSVLFGFLGGHTGSRVEKYLTDEGLKCDFNWTANETRENLILTVEGADAQTRISLPGPPIREDELHRLMRKIAARSREFDYLVLSGSLPPGVPKDIYATLASEARLRGDKVVLDADGPALTAGLKARPYLVKPNRYELERLIGRELPDAEAIHRALDELKEQATYWIVSQGGGQLIAQGPEGRFEVSPPEVKARSSVGAGDSLVAGLLYRLSREAGLEDALRWGVACGAACAASVGTELAHYRDVQVFLPEVEIRQVSR